MQSGERESITVAELDRVREQFHRELMRKSMRIAELELSLERLRLEFESSLSWRLTRPLRLRGWVRKLRAGAHANQ